MKAIVQRLRPNAPRFHALLERTEGRSIFILSRAVWESWKVQAGSLVLLTTEDLSETPVAAAPSFLVGAATRTGERVEISIFRVDLEDHPNPINADTWEVWEELPARINIPQMVNAASTGLDPNFRRYLSEHVFLVKEKAGPGHHLPALPHEVVILLKRL